MKKFALIAVSLLITALSVYSQNFLLTIDGKNVNSEEFERLYLKNNSQTKVTDSDLNDYLNLFIDYKLKILEAYNLGYDTLKELNDEFNMYLSQLSEPYFLDTAEENKLLVESYDRSKKEVRLSYIMIKLLANEDTTAAFNKAMQAYNRLLKGEKFEKVAVEMSDVPTVKRDLGDSWYNRVFWMPYNIENFAFNGKIGDFSKPILANNSYFILKITDIRNVPQSVRASHVYVRLPLGASVNDSVLAFKKIDSIKLMLNSGKSFAELAKIFSDDKRSSVNGGDIGWFTTGKMFHEFENALYSIKVVGNWAGPVRTPAGYHFVQLTDRKYLGTFEQEKNDLLKQLKDNPRYNLVKENVYNNLKKQYNFKMLSNLDKFYTTIDSSLLKYSWQGNALNSDNSGLFTFADKIFTNADFANYLLQKQKNFAAHSIQKIVDKTFEQFVKDQLKDYELTQLPKKNDDFKNLMQEYHDGLMLFDITNDVVWQKAADDSIGLRNYYDQNRKNYTQRISFSIFTYKDKKTYNKLIKLLNSKIAKNYTDDSIVKILNKKDTVVTLQKGIYKQGDNEDIDYLTDQIVNGTITLNQNIVSNTQKSKIYRIYDSFDYVKGLLIADYQEVMMNQWMQNLRKKYNVQINQSEWQNLKKKYLTH